MLRKTFFGDETTHAFALGLAYEKIFGSDALEWEPKTSYEAIVHSGYNEISETNATKLNAYRTARATLLPWSDWQSFELVINGLNGNIATFQTSMPCKIHHIMAGIDTLRIIRQTPFADDVKRYIAACGKYAELDFLPDPLTFCMKYLCRPKYKCLDCGHTNYDDLIDDRCDFCTGRYEDGVLRDKPQPGLENRGANIQKFDEYDYYEVANKFDSMKQLSRDKISLGLSYVDIQLTKLLDMNDYRASMKNVLNENLQELKQGGYYV
jgi:hypothetical protein